MPVTRSSSSTCARRPSVAARVWLVAAEAEATNSATSRIVSGQSVPPGPVEAGTPVVVHFQSE